MNEIIATEDVANVVTEEIAYGEAVDTTALKVAAGVGVLLIAGLIVYKKVIKPRRDAKKAEKAAAKKDNDNVTTDELFDDE